MAKTDLIPLPAPEDRRLLEKKSHSGEVSYRLAGESRVVATFSPVDRWLTKKVDLGKFHNYRKKPGIALNLEVLALHDRTRPAPAGFTVKVRDEDGETSHSCGWLIVKAFALAACAGDQRYLVEDDVDRQVLIPWPAWRGEITEPPPLAPAKVEPVKPLSGAEEVPLFELGPEPAASAGHGDPPQSAKRDQLPICPQCLRADIKPAKKVRTDPFGQALEECEFHAVKKAHEGLVALGRLAR